MQKLSAVQFVLILALMFAGAPLAMAQFDGVYAPANWTETLGGDPPGGGDPAGIDWSGAPASVLLIGGDEGCDDDFWPDEPEGQGIENLAAGERAGRGARFDEGCYTEIRVTAPAAGPVSFDFDFVNLDEDDCCEIFGYFVNDDFTMLTDPDEESSFSGSADFAVSAGDEFGFRINCTDCVAGHSEVTISNFSAPAPASAVPAVAVPVAGWPGLVILMIMTGLLGVFVLRR